MTIHSISTKRATRSAEARVAAQDWGALVGDLNSYGSAVMPALLPPRNAPKSPRSIRMRNISAAMW